MMLLAFCVTACGPQATSTGRDELIALARSGDYASWKVEPAQHRSTGPHGGTVRTFVNDALHASLKSGAVEHPNGSIAVKELFTDGQRTGWAIDRKRSDGTWEFYEGFEPSLDQYYFEGTSNLCANCHRDGVDYVLVPAANFPD